ILFESPRRLAATLGDLAAVLGDRPAAVARELTKRFEEVRRGGLASLARDYTAAGAPKGEIVIVVAPPAPGAAPPRAEGAAATEESDAVTLDDRLRRALKGSSVRDAAIAVAAATGLPRRHVYARAVQLAAERQGR